MKLFELNDNYEVGFEPELFLIKAFKDLRKSREDDTGLLLKELGFVYFFCDMNSDFQYAANEKERETDVKALLGLDDKWRPDNRVMECMRVYEQLNQSVSSNLLKSVYIAVDKVREHLETINLKERDKSNKPVYNQKDIIASIKQIPDLLKSIRAAETEFIMNREQGGRLKGNKEKTVYEDGYQRMAT